MINGNVTGLARANSLDQATNRDRTEIDLRVEELRNQIDYLLKQSLELEERLRPVLNPGIAVPVSPGTQCVDAKREMTSRTPLGQELETFVTRLGSLNGNVEILIRNLAI